MLIGQTVFVVERDADRYGSLVATLYALRGGEREPRDGLRWFSLLVQPLRQEQKGDCWLSG